MDIVKFGLVIYIGMAHGNRQELVIVNKTSPFTLPEIWTQTGEEWNNNGINLRSSKIDQWYHNTPQKIVLSLRDIYNQSLAWFTYNSTGSSNDLASILRYNRILYALPFEYVFGLGKYEVKINNGMMIFSDVNNGNQAYLIHGRLNASTTDQISCFGKKGYPFLINEALSKLNNDKKVLVSTVFQDQTGFRSIRVNRTIIIYKPYITGFSINNDDNPRVEFTLQYTSVKENCDGLDYQYVMKSSHFVCDGSVYNTDVIRGQCLIITFSQKVYRVRMTLFTPAENYICLHNIQLSAEYDEYPTTEASTHTENLYTNTTLQDICYCQCGKIKNINLNDTMIDQLVEQIKRELSVEKKALSSAVRKKSSASDTRPSAQSVGFVGAFLICVEICFLICLDLRNLCHFLKNMFTRVLLR